MLKKCCMFSPVAFGLKVSSLSSLAAQEEALVLQSAQLATVSHASVSRLGFCSTLTQDSDSGQPGNII